MALRHRGVRGGLYHSDRGVKYESRAKLLRQCGRRKLPSDGDERLLINGIFETRVRASRELFEFIEIWYNRQRRHSSLDYRTPMHLKRKY